MIPATTRRVPLHTREEDQQRIDRDVEKRMAQYRHAPPEAIRRRLEELDREWDIERTLEANAATVAFTGCLLAATVDRRWILLPIAVTSFLFQHAIEGWCPPVPLFRRLGFRTQREIDDERTALKLLRGDFRHLANAQDASTTSILEAVHR